MQLRQKLVFQTVALITGMIVISGVAIWGFESLRHSATQEMEEYDEIRELQATKILLMRVLDRSEKVGLVGDVRADLQQAIAALESFASEHHHAEHIGDTAHQHRERTASDHMTKQLKAILGEEGKQKDQKSISTIQAELGVVMKQLDELADFMDVAVESEMQTARRTHRFARTVLISVAILIVLIAVGTGLLQYRGIMRPVEALRKGAKALAKGDLENRVPILGDDDLASLGHDFNRMADELSDLYRTMEDRIEQKSRKLVRSERLASVGFLAAGIGHEINNPLGIIAGYAQEALLDIDPDDPDQQPIHRVLTIVCEESFRCKDIVGKLLSMVRPEAGKTPFSIGQSIMQVADMVSGLNMYQDRKLECRFTTGSDIVVLGNEPEIRQVFLNLIVNGLEAVDEGTGTVIIETAEREGWVDINVSDNGRGMAAEDIEHVFEPFFTTRRGSQGHGLGLSISFAIIQSHGGVIHATSDGPGQGSTFTVRLPLVPKNEGNRHGS